MADKLRYYYALLFLVPWTILGVVAAILGKLITPNGFIAVWVGRIWSWGILKVTGMRLSVDGLEHLDPKGQYIFISNHSSAFDIPALYWGLPQALAMLAKIELAYIPFFGWAMWAAGHFFVNRRDHSKAVTIMQQVGEKMKRRSSRSLVIFVEGTRSLDGELARFKKGAFLLSLETGIPVVPVVVNGAYLAKSKYERSIQAVPIQLKVLPPMLPQNYSHETRHQYLDDAYALFQENYIRPSSD